MPTQKTPPKPQQLTVAVSDISETLSDENPNQLSDQDFRGLCEAVARLDFAQAVTLRQRAGQQFDVVDGNHRLRAARVAGLTELPALVYPESMTDAQLRALRLALNRWRGDPRPDVVAADLKFLHAEGFDREDLYAASGWDRSELDLLLGEGAGSGGGESLDDLAEQLPDPEAGSAGGERGPTERTEDSPSLEIVCSTGAGSKELRELLGRAAKRAGARGKFRLEKAALWALRRALEED
jgi:ParB-like chromosome segregation protein Spo0J